MESLSIEDDNPVSNTSVSPASSLRERFRLTSALSLYTTTLCIEQDLMSKDCFPSLISSMIKEEKNPEKQSRWADDQLVSHTSYWILTPPSSVPPLGVACCHDSKSNMADSSRCSSVNSDAFELPASTWMVIQSCCPQKEANEVKRAVGQSLIEEACDLHTEVSI